VPGEPVLYRVGRWNTEPRSVMVEASGRVLVNQGGDLARAESEAAVNGSRTSAWYYDAPARRLIVKSVPVP
jgi:hypothetical protein